MTDRPVVLIGAGDHAKVLLSVLLLIGARIAAVVDSAPRRAGTVLLGLPVIGGDVTPAAWPPDSVRLVNGVGSVGQPEPRRKVYERFKALGYEFANVVHPAAIVGPEVALGEGTQIMAGAVVQAGTRVGVNAIINTHASVDHDCRIGDHVHVAPGAVLCGSVTVEESSHIGAGAVVVQYATVGPNTLVPAGSLVKSGKSAP